MSDKTELLPCPFCGSTASIEVRLLEYPDWWTGCANCDGINDHICSCQMIVGASTEQDARDGIIEAWNRRTYLKEQNDALRELVELMWKTHCGPPTAYGWVAVTEEAERLGISLEYPK